MVWYARKARFYKAFGVQNEPETDHCAFLSANTAITGGYDLDISGVIKLSRRHSNRKIVAAWAPNRMHSCPRP